MSVTLDISAGSLKLVSINGNRVEKWGTAPLSPGMVRDGVILQPQAVGAAIDALFQDLKITKGGLNATITGLSFTYRMLRLPRVKPALTTEAILRAAKKEIPLALDEIYLSWRIIETTKEEIEVFLFGAPRNLIDAGIAAGGIQDRPAIVQLAGTLAIQNHVERRAVFHRPARLKYLGLGENLHARELAGNPIEPQQGSVPDGREQPRRFRQGWLKRGVKLAMFIRTWTIGCAVAAERSS